MDIKEYLKVDIKILAVTIYFSLDEHSKGAFILESIRERHFGRLPDIIFEEIRYKVDSTEEEGMQVYSQIEPLIASGNITQIFSKNLDAFYLTMIRLSHNVPFLKNLLGKIITLEISAAEADKTQIKICRLHAEGYIKFKETKFKQALTKLTTAQKLITIDVGSACGPVLDLLSLRAICCVHLGHKTKAEKFMKELRRCGSSKEELKPIKDIISAMTLNKKTKMKVKTVSRCWNPFCDKVEKKIGQFQKCSRCDIAKYCSRKCQRRHWKAGHKK